VKRAQVKNWMFTAAMPRLALSAIVAIMAIMSTFALWQTMTATDQVDRERAAVAINALLLNHVQRLEVYTAEQAYSDELAQELYGTGAAPAASIRNTWLQTSLGDDHDIGFAFSNNGEQKFAVSAGETSQNDFRTLHKTAIAALTARITETSDCVGGIMWTKDGARILTVARVRPVADERLLGAVQSRSAYIALSKPLDEDVLAHVGKLLGIKGVAIDSGTNSESDLASTAVTQQVGDRSMDVVWQPVGPGRQALERSLPLILAALAGGVALVLLLSQLISKLLSAALRDTLSHLPNRRSLELRIAQNTAQKKRQAIALLNLDGFKRINDTYGTHVGDRAIKVIAELLMRLAPDTAMVARLGGDEFAVLMPVDDSSEPLQHMMAAFHNSLAEPLVVGDIRLHLSATIGLSDNVAADGNAAPDLLIQCDRALSAAKLRCRGQILVYDATLANEFAAATALAAQVDQALSNDQLEMVFQPLVDARSGMITAAEALLRWRPESGIVAGPEQVIAAAEKHGLGMKLAHAALQNACQQAARWPDVKIAVNVTPAQFLDPNLPIYVADVLAANDMPAERLELEVTESIAIADEAVFAQQFERLQAMGIQLALDDFGSGYASIGFLRRFPFQKLKIDKSLVDDSMARASGREMLIACVSTARALGIQTVAEGIETANHRDIARAAGCDLLQGYFLGKPLSSREFEDMLNAQRDWPLRNSA
jgi:diguanylate cyclase (GGDEF)-like protein